MSQILSFPFRIADNGSVATVEQTSDQASAEQLAMLVLTRAGERVLVPGLGITDPVGQGIDEAEVLAAAAAYQPSLDITGISVTEDGTGGVRVNIEFR